MQRRPREPDWHAYLLSWDAQQAEHNPDRERRFNAMFDVLQGAVGRRFTALDLGCGPGSLTQRMLRRFPRARSVAIDYDPVVLRIGQGALGTMGGRITWVDAKLASRGWTRLLPKQRYDAALSTTALHWLRSRELALLYRDLHGLLRPGGVLLNGDIMPWGEDERLRRISRKVYQERFHTPSGQPRFRGWERWWARAEKEPHLRHQVEERKARSAKHPHDAPPAFEAHVAALRRAGFDEIAVVWQEIENRILMAIR